jgi:hypothetical protein
MSVADLLSQWQSLYHTWPSDGWDGAAEARAVHHRKVMAVERQILGIETQLAEALKRIRWHEEQCQVNTGHRFDADGVCMHCRATETKP